YESFLHKRIEVWKDLSRDHVAVALSLTPLGIQDDRIDPLSNDAQRCLERAIRGWGPPIQEVNRRHTRPTEWGLVNERLSELPDRTSHSIHLFRVGHCEYFRELGTTVDEDTNY